MATKKIGRPGKGQGKMVLRGVKLEPEQDEALERAAYWARLTVSDIIRRGIISALQDIYDKKNKGKSFPPIPDEE